MADILLVDDEHDFSAALARMLRAAEHTVVTADHLSSARDLLAEKAFDLLLIDLMLPDGNGLELLDGLGDRRPPRVIMITGHPAIKANIRHLHGPGLQYLTKPIDPQELMSIVAAEQATAQSHQNLHFGLIVGASEPMLELVEQIKQVGPSDVSVIITGESGTGKELVAQAVHRESRCSGPFVAVNCGGLTSELVASELFGHEKGSFTGANKRHLGSFERAEDGTLFLDEISEMPMDQQPHLLRALESRAITRVGGEADIAYNARIISASNRDLADAVHAGHLREDLYFRLSVYPLHIPPLRERKADIKPLAEMFLHNLNSRHDSDMELDERALNALESWHWPGNVRELKHAMHRCYILTKDKSGALHVPADFGFDLSNGAGNGIEAGRSIRDVEHDLITKTLKHFDGNRKAAAEVLGISLKTLYNRLSEYNEDA